MADFALQHTNNMRVARPYAHDGDTNWYVVTANGYPVRGPFGSGVVGKEHAETVLANFRRRAREELAEESAS